jgi:Domain of unknown function (DU1801)
MVSSSANTVDAYLAELSPERRKVIATMRDMVNAHLPPGYEETMNWGMISWEIPLSRYPVTYNKQPLNYVALAAQKNKYSLYLMSVVADSEHEHRLRAAAAAMGKTLDMGKCCVRFKRCEDLPLEVIGELIASMPAGTYIADYEARRGTAR